MKKFKCKICGHMIEAEELPSDYKCPLCGVGSDLFLEVVDDSEAVLEIIKNTKPDLKKKKYRCRVCGYMLETSELDADYKCPLCGLGVEFFDDVSKEEAANDELISEEIDKRIPIELDNPGIARIMEKCINCGRCKTICEESVGIHYDYALTKCAVCIHCGQCILNCPVGALIPKYQYKAVEKEINNPNKIVIGFTSPAVRVALGESFKMPPGSFVEGKMIKSLRQVGFDYVFDTTFGADLTIMEEASELIERIQHKKSLPQFTSCCPAWVKYVEMYYPKLRDHLSSSKSPISMQGAMIKTYFAKMKGIDPSRIVTVALTPCTAKKYEINRPELCDGGKYLEKDIRDTDYVITTNEFAVMLKEHKIDFANLENSNYDQLLEKGSGAGIIFGNSGGVMEASIRTAYYLLTGKLPEEPLLKFTDVRGLKGVKEAKINIQGIILKVAVVHEIPNMVPLLEKLKKEKSLEYDFIEVMNCRGGCIGGGGQPLTAINQRDEILTKRMEGLYHQDEKEKIKCSFENPDIKKIYQDFLDSPLSPLAEKLLHTSYEDKSALLKEANSFDIIDNRNDKKEGENLWN